MVEPTAAVDVSSAVEANLYNSVQAMVRGINSQNAPHKGMLRWALHKRMETYPDQGVSFISMLVKELQKVDETKSDMHVIPQLHTLSSVVVQPGAVPDGLYQSVYDGLMKLLVLPLPYSAVAISNLRSIRMEMSTPGASYHRRVTAEQDLRSKHFSSQEKVFVLADPAVFSGPLEAAVRAELGVTGPSTDTLTQMKTVVLHTLQMVLGKACESTMLVQALETLKEHLVQRYFQEVSLAVEQSVEHGALGHTNYLNRLQHIYRDIMTTSKGGAAQVDRGSVYRTAVPPPQINFLMWNNDEDLWDLLTNFALASCPDPGVEEQEKRDSVQSVDSGIGLVRDPREFDNDKEQPPDRNPQTTLAQSHAVHSLKLGDKPTLMRERTEASSSSSPRLQQEQSHTARVVVMGDDRVLGRLAKAYYRIRKESRHLILDKQLNLQFYYIPVTDSEPVLHSPGGPCQDEDKLTLGSLLGRVDPWYHCNINSLGAVIPKLAKMHSNHNKPSEQSLFLLDTLSYYLRCGMQPVNLPIYSVKITCSSSDVRSTVEEVFVSHLQADFPEFRHLKEKQSRGSSLSRKKRSTNVFGAVISASYKKISLSKREVVTGMAATTCGVTVKIESPTATAGQDYLVVSFDSTNPLDCTEIHAQNISMKTLEQRTFTLCLDKDSRRTYNDVQRIEISPCLDPDHSFQHRGNFRFSFEDEQELALSRCLNKVLSLPINTFSGVML
ncbi:phosphoinositide 3-kinase regulatory subunit 6 [Myripristis murdjan]|uniref:phosphoinositide 3-kinase regulatory subunit 6 n=1 Tax=Myripristis murdjan TaxID=586833 RepID=UPI001176165C|nr:phosphoinositide 3-kinase regulatory subunit 6-like [Myripristis murdjan]